MTGSFVKITRMSSFANPLLVANAYLASRGQEPQPRDPGPRRPPTKRYGCPTVFTLRVEGPRDPETGSGDGGTN